MEKRNRWTAREVRTMKVRFKDGLSDQMIGEELNRTADSVSNMRRKHGLTRKQGRKVGQRSARVVKSNTKQMEVSILWGLIKYTKA